MLTQRGLELLGDSDPGDCVIRNKKGVFFRVDNVCVSISKKHREGKDRDVTLEFSSGGEVVSRKILSHFRLTDTIRIAGQGMLIPITFTAGPDEVDKC